MKILSVANQKGGVGKSTLTVHLAYAALEAGLRVLLVDMDKQGSLSRTFTNNENISLNNLVTSELFSEAVIEKLPEVISEKLSIIRADIGLLSVDKAENEVIKRVGAALKPRFTKDFDLCLIDTPPSLGIVLMAAMTASDFVLTPVALSDYEMAGVPDLMNTIHVVRTQGFNPRLRHIGILPTKINNRSSEEKLALSSLREKYGSMIFSEELPERAPVRKAIALRRPVWVNTKGSGHLKAAKEWRAACDSVLTKIKVKG